MSRHHLAVARGARLALFEVAGDALYIASGGEAPAEVPGASTSAIARRARSSTSKGAALDALGARLAIPDGDSWRVRVLPR